MPGIKTLRMPFDIPGQAGCTLLLLRILVARKSQLSVQV